MPKDLVIRMIAALSFLLKWGFLLNIYHSCFIEISLTFPCQFRNCWHGGQFADMKYSFVLARCTTLEQAWAHWHLNHSCLANFLNLCNFTWHSCLYLNQTFKFRREKQTMLDLGGNSLGIIEIIIKSYELKYPHILLVKPIQSTWKYNKYHWILVRKVWWQEYPYFLLFLFSLGIVWGFSIFCHEHEPLIDIKVAPIRAFTLNYHTPNDFHH